MDENSDVSNNKDQVESKDESNDEDKSIFVRKAVSMKAGMEGNNFYRLRCDIQSSKNGTMMFVCRCTVTQFQPD